MSTCLGEREGANGPCHGEHQPHTLACLHRPEAHLLVGATGGQVVHVWVELAHLDVRDVTGKDAHRAVVLLVPDAGGAVIRAGCEVVAKGSELDVPDGELVAVIDNHAGARLDRPAAHRAVLRAGDEELVVEADADGEYWPAVAHQRELTLLSNDLALLCVGSQVEGEALAVLEGANDRGCEALGGRERRSLFVLRRAPFRRSWWLWQILRVACSLILVSIQLHLQADVGHDAILLPEHLLRVLLLEGVTLRAHAQRAHQTGAVEPEDLDRAVAHACGKEVACLAEGRAIDLPVRVQQVD